MRSGTGWASAPRTARSEVPAGNVDARRLVAPPHRARPAEAPFHRIASKPIPDRRFRLRTVPGHGAARLPTHQEDPIEHQHAEHDEAEAPVAEESPAETEDEERVADLPFEDDQQD